MKLGLKVGKDNRTMNKNSATDKFKAFSSQKLQDIKNKLTFTKTKQISILNSC